MPADYTVSKVAKDEQPSSSKFDAFVDALQASVNIIGDTTKSGFAAGLWLDPAQVKQAAASSGEMLAWNGTDWAHAVAPAGPAFSLITDTTLGSPSSTFDFTGIAGTFKHLMLFGYIRSDKAGSKDDIQLNFNGDAGSNYDSYTYGEAGAAPSNTGTEHLGAAFAQMDSAPPAANAPANTFNAFQLWLPHYAGTANNKIGYAESDWKQGVTPGDLGFNSHLVCWRSNSAITRVALTLSSAGSFVTGCRMILCGIS